MLRQRIATAIVLLVGLIAMTTSLGLEAFAAVTGALVLIGAWEWAAFASLGSKSRLAFVGTVMTRASPSAFHYLARYFGRLCLVRSCPFQSQLRHGMTNPESL